MDRFAVYSSIGKRSRKSGEKGANSIELSGNGERHSERKKAVGLCAKTLEFGKISEKRYIRKINCCPSKVSREKLIKTKGSATIKRVFLFKLNPHRILERETNSIDSSGTSATYARRRANY
jgi:hypothetical protein